MIDSINLNFIPHLFSVQERVPSLQDAERRVGFGVGGQGPEVRVAGGGGPPQRVDRVPAPVGDDERQVRGHLVLHGDHRDGCKPQDGWRSELSTVFRLFHLVEHFWG